MSRSQFSLSRFCASLTQRGYHKTRTGRTWAWATVFSLVLNVATAGGAMIPLASAQTAPPKSSVPADGVTGSANPGNGNAARPADTATATTAPTATTGVTATSSP